MAAPPVDRELLDFALSVARQGGDLAAERFFAADFRTSVKADGTEVTDADLAVEDLIRAGLQRHCPADGFYGEERGAAAGSSGRRWIADPIDGTLYFAHRVPLFRTLLAYEDEHGPAIGIMYRPVDQQMIVAGRGLGCWLRLGGGPDQPPVLRPRTSLREVRAELVNPGSWHPGLLLALHRSVTTTGYLGGFGSLLTGLLDAVVIAGFPMGYEDLAPLPVIMAEAGGRVTDLAGGPVLTGPGTALVSTGHRHAELLSLVAGLPHGQQQA